MSSPISIVALKLLLECIQERSRSRGIAKSGIPSRTADRYIAKMRQLFGDKLFDGDRPIPAALKLEPHLQSLVQSYLEVTSGGPLDPNKTSLHVKVGLIGAATEALASALTERVRLQAPNVMLEFVPFTGDRFEALRDRLVDFVICPEAGTIGRPLYLLPLSLGRLVLVCDPKHTLAHQKPPLDDESVTRYSFIDVITHHPHGRERLLRHEHYPPWRKAFSAAKVTLGVAMCMSLVGLNSLMILPERVAKILEQGQAVKILETKSDHKPLRYHLIWHESTNSDPAMQWIRSIFSQASCD